MSRRTKMVAGLFVLSFITGAADGMKPVELGWTLFLGVVLVAMILKDGR